MNNKNSVDCRLIEVGIDAANRIRDNLPRWNPNLYLDERTSRIYLSENHLPFKVLGGVTLLSSLNDVVKVKRLIIHDQRFVERLLPLILSPRVGLVCRRFVLDFAKKIPSWRLKNLIYSSMGIGLQDRQRTVVAPNVNLDYIFPKLICQLGCGSVIGEESMILTHLLYPDRIELGEVRVGKNTVIGARSIVFPGVTIPDNYVVPAGAMVAKDPVICRHSLIVCQEDDVDQCENSYDRSLR